MSDNGLPYEFCGVNKNCSCGPRKIRPLWAPDPFWSTNKFERFEECYLWSTTSDKMISNAKIRITVPTGVAQHCTPKRKTA